ncbi:MAG: hypothetical protein AAF871_05270 [Pseudomonadota bacterium]
MTALDEYQRLEAAGIWRPGKSDQRRNVVVAIGSASLTVKDMADVALAHWSLPALDRVNPGVAPAIYRPAKDAPDRLEIADKEMIDAIEKVRRAVNKGRSKPGKLRISIVAAVLLSFGAAVAFWAPSAIRNQAAAILPPAARDAIGADLLRHMERIAGAPCATPEGQAALNRLTASVVPERMARVMPDALVGAKALPGGVILLGRGIVEDHDTPFVAAGYLVEADLKGEARDPIRALLDDATLVEAGQLLSTGRLADRALAAHAARLAQGGPPAPADAEIVARFAALGLPAAPYAYARDISGETVLGLIEADPVPVSSANPPIDDGAWIALQGICEG